MHFHDDGLFIGQFGTSADQFNWLTHRGSYNNTRPLPGNAGYNAWAALVEVDGETYLWSNDKTTRYGLVRWHLAGAHTIRELRGRGALGSAITLSASGFAPYPTALQAEPGDGQVTLSWQPAAGASSYDVKFSERRGGPYRLLARAIPETRFTDKVTNGARRYYVVGASGQDAHASNEAVAMPFDTVGKTGELTSGPLTPWQVSSAAPLHGQPALREINGAIGNLIRNAIGAGGYVIYNWGGVDDSDHGVDAQNLPPGISVTRHGPWRNRDYSMMSSFTVDGARGEDAALSVEPEAAGSIDIEVSDADVHYLTVFCPTLSDHNPHAFTVQLTPQAAAVPAATYTVNDPADGGDNHVFQFEFRGHVTLSVTSTGTFPQTVNGSLQAIFLD